MLIDSNRQVKLSDFGLLRRFDSDDARMTQEGSVVGTPHYMAPEQAEGRAVDERTDIFSLGLTFFHIFSGQLPINGPNMTAVMLKIIRGEIPELHDVAPNLPSPLSVILKRMSMPSPDDRYQEVETILMDLAAYERRGILSFSEGDHQAPEEDAHSPAMEATGEFCSPDQSTFTEDL